MFSDVNVGETDEVSENREWTGECSPIKILFQNEEPELPKDQARPKGEKILPKLLSNTKGNANVAKRSAKDMSKLKPNGDQPKASKTSKGGDMTGGGSRPKTKKAKKKESVRPTLKTSKKKEAKKKKMSDLNNKRRNQKRKIDRNLVDQLRIHLPGCSQITEKAVLLERAIMFILLLDHNDEDLQE